MKYSGFTLIELMITVAIIAIIAAVAYPSYIEQVKKTRRANAQADLVELASYMERYYTENFSYEDAEDSLPFGESPKEGSTKYYDLSAGTPTSTEFTLTAAPKNSQDDDHCGTMTLDQTGARTASETDCW